MAALLEVKDLVAGYGGVPVLDGVGLSVETGKVVAIIGPNGAGKSTLIRAIMGEVRNAAGSIRLGLEEIGDWPVEARARAGLALVPEGRR
ncbi:MAG: ATP-binding cassette domain-containing protein, partial [Alphaproteobacteria bacterium]|nr:ATP-binding cassette domain-containing protein [Alphaproteobacteria bacterium]